jgi:hypothetical protein
MRPTLILAFATLTIGCGGTDSDCPDGFARDNNDNCVELGSDDGGDNGSGDNGSGDDGGDDNLKGVGDACEFSSDCSSGICVFQWGDDVLGVCTESCNSWSDCSQSFWECCDLSNGGFVCTPDSWVDELGLECS